MYAPARRAHPELFRPPAPAAGLGALALLARAPLIGLTGAVVGEVRVERREDRTWLHLLGAGRVAGPTLDLLLSPSARPLRQGDHGGPGPGAVRVGSLDRAEVRLLLMEGADLRRTRTLWLWCPAVRARLRWGVLARN